MMAVKYVFDEELFAQLYEQRHGQTPHDNMLRFVKKVISLVLAAYGRGRNGNELDIESLLRTLF